MKTLPRTEKGSAEYWKESVVIKITFFNVAQHIKGKTEDHSDVVGTQFRPQLITLKSQVHCFDNAGLEHAIQESWPWLLGAVFQAMQHASQGAQMPPSGRLIVCAFDNGNYPFFDVQTLG